MTKNMKKCYIKLQHFSKLKGGTEILTKELESIKLEHPDVFDACMMVIKRKMKL